MGDPGQCRLNPITFATSTCSGEINAPLYLDDEVSGLEFYAHHRDTKESEASIRRVLASFFGSFFGSLSWNLFGLSSLPVS